MREKTQQFRLRKSAKQGGVDKLVDALNLIMEEAMEPCIERWEVQGFGFSRSESGLLTHAVCADKIYMFATARDNLSWMMRI